MQFRAIFSSTIVFLACSATLAIAIPLGEKEPVAVIAARSPDAAAISLSGTQLTPKWEVPDLSRRDVQLSKDLEKHITNVTSVLNESLHSLTTQLEQTDVSGTVLSLLQMSIDLLKTPTTHSTRDLIHKRLLGLNPIQILSIVVDLLQQVLSQVSGTALDTLGRIINQLQDLIKQLSA